MSDILQELRKAVEMRPGTADSDVNVLLIQVPVDLLKRTIAELEYLRAMYGAVSDGPSYADIAKDARHDLPVSERTDG